MYKHYKCSCPSNTHSYKSRSPEKITCNKYNLQLRVTNKIYHYIPHKYEKYKKTFSQKNLYPDTMSH